MRSNCRWPATSFAAPPAPSSSRPTPIRLLVGGLPRKDIYWLNAADPASLCGLGLSSPSKGLSLPARRPTTHLVYHGSQLKVCSRKSGAKLEIHASPEDEHLVEYLGFLRVRLTRQAHPEKRIVVQEINGEPAAESPYVDALTELVDVSRERTALCLMRRY